MTDRRWYPVRNAYQKIRVGDQVLYREMERTILATVTAKEALGFLAVMGDGGKVGRILGVDVVQIYRKENGR